MNRSIKMFDSPLLIVGFLLFSHCLYCQMDVRIGDWQEYYPYDRGTAVAQSNDQIFYASNVGLLALQKSDMRATYIAKTDGLSDVEIRSLNYNRASDILVLAYQSGGVDLIYPDEILSLNNIINANLGVTERNIDGIFFESQQFAFLATNFGLVQILLESGTFGFTTLIDGGVRSFAIFNDRYFVSTDEGIYTAPISPDFNHADFGLWQPLDKNGLPPNYVSLGMAVFNGRLYADVNGDLVDISADDARIVLDAGIQDIKWLNSGSTHLMMGMECAGCLDDVFFMNEDEQFQASNASCIGNSRWAVEDEQGRIFYADGESGIRFSRGPEMPCEYLDLEQPMSSTSGPFFIPTDIYFGNDELLFASGGVTQNFNYTFNQAGLQIYKDGMWSAINAANTPALSDPVINDFFKVTRHPSDGRIFVATFWNGLLEIFPDGTVNVYDDQNSCIQKFPEEGLRERISSVVFDEEQRLWLTNHSAPNELLLFDRDFNCYPFSTSPVRGLTSLLITPEGHKWAVSTDQNNGLVVFDEGILEDPSDDRMKFVTSGNSALTTNRTNDMAIDLDGDIWVGTEQGVITFDCAANIFEPGGCFGTQRRVDVGGNIALLLENENVTAVAVDGANRKWFGTRNGIFVIDAAGEILLQEFNASNSPLPANNIQNIDINPQTGEVFISTTKGLISYRTDATEGDAFFHDSEVVVFPNPVRPGYDGLIGIKGLPRNATVKITDVSGKLIFETTANGGQAVWDGRDYNGRKASSGVYLVFSSSQDNFNKPDALVSKIVFVK